MMRYRPCPFCGCSLDPGEICDCNEKNAAPQSASLESGKAMMTNEVYQRLEG